MSLVQTRLNRNLLGHHKAPQCFHAAAPGQMERTKTDAEAGKCTAVAE